MLAQAREEGLHLEQRGVLRLVEQDEGVGPGAPAHHLERHHLDVPVLERDVEGALADALADGLDDRRGPGRELLLQRTGEEAERAAGGDVGASEDDPPDPPLAEEIGRMGGGHPGLSGAGGAEHDGLGIGLQGCEVGGLGGVERLDRRKGPLVLELGADEAAVEFDDLTGFEGATGAALLLVVTLAQEPVSLAATRDHRPGRRVGAAGRKAVSGDGMRVRVELRGYRKADERNTVASWHAGKSRDRDGEGLHDASHDPRPFEGPATRASCPIRVTV